MARILILVAAAFSCCGWTVEIVRAPGTVEEINAAGEIRTWHDWWRPEARGPGIRFVAIPAPLRMALPPNALPDGEGVAASPLADLIYLADPTSRYRHAVLGDAIEASALVIERSGKQERVEAGHDAVFEDLIPRLHDLDGDGLPEIVVVKSYLKKGAALAVIGRDRFGKFSVIAETPPIGTPNRWLNPAGFGDFTGRGAQEIALVRMPHVLGRLEIWRWRKGKLAKVVEIDGVSNHAIGSRLLRLSVVADFDGDGTADMAIPSLDRRTLRILSFRDGVREIAAVPLSAQADIGMIRLNLGGKPAILAGLRGGTLVMVRP
jgi:hypothetical protein